MSPCTTFGPSRVDLCLLFVCNTAGRSPEHQLQHSRQRLACLSSGSGQYRGQWRHPPTRISLTSLPVSLPCKIHFIPSSFTLREGYRCTRPALKRVKTLSRYPVPQRAIICRNSQLSGILDSGTRFIHRIGNPELKDCENQNLERAPLLTVTFTRRARETRDSGQN